jgi:hypothetical protein
MEDEVEAIVDGFPSFIAKQARNIPLSRARLVAFERTTKTSRKWFLKMHFFSLYIQVKSSRKSVESSFSKKSKSSCGTICDDERDLRFVGRPEAMFSGS